MEPLEYPKHVPLPLNRPRFHFRRRHLQKLPNLQTPRRGRTKKAKNRRQEHNISSEKTSSKMWRPLRFHPPLQPSSRRSERNCSFLRLPRRVSPPVLNKILEKPRNFSSNKPKRQYSPRDADIWRASQVPGGAQEGRANNGGALLHPQVQDALRAARADEYGATVHGWGNAENGQIRLLEWQANWPNTSVLDWMCQKLKSSLPNPGKRTIFGQ